MPGARDDEESSLLRHLEFLSKTRAPEVEKESCVGFGSGRSEDFPSGRITERGYQWRKTMGFPGRVRGFNPVVRRDVHRIWPACGRLWLFHVFLP